MAAQGISRMLSDDDVTLVVLEYIIKSGLNKSPTEVASWTRTLIARLETRSLQTEADRLKAVLDGTSESPLVVLDDVIPQPVVSITGPDGKPIMPNPDGSYTVMYNPEPRGHDGLTSSERKQQMLSKLTARINGFPED
jgi:hypothetical protein